jgi:uncharacterized protein YbjT (DUF2867 family)
MRQPKENIVFKLLSFLLLTVLPLLAAPAAAQDNTGIVVVGGTGQLGAYHVQHLSAAGERVIVLARPTSSFERLDGATYAVVFGDLQNADEIMAAIIEAKPAVIIVAANLPGIRLEDGEAFYEPAMNNLVAAARAAGVTQVILHSVHGARQTLQTPLGDPKVTNYMRDTARAEIVLEDSGLAYTIVRNAGVPPEPAAPTGRGRLRAAELNPMGLITRSDLARITNTCILNPACYGNIYDGFDPEMPGR